MKYFYDTEFLEDGKTIELISIGIVAEDGREYYAVNADADWQRIRADEWLMHNVVRHLPFSGDDEWKPKARIRDEVSAFLVGDGVELWADYAAYDHVALAQLFGRMIDLPSHVPMFTNDFQQRFRTLGSPELPEQTDGVHDALADARHLKHCFGRLGPKPKTSPTLG